MHLTARVLIRALVTRHDTWHECDKNGFKAAHVWTNNKQVQCNDTLSQVFVIHDLCACLGVLCIHHVATHVVQTYLHSNMRFDLTLL